MDGYWIFVQGSLQILFLSECFHGLQKFVGHDEIWHDAQNMTNHETYTYIAETKLVQNFLNKLSMSKGVNDKKKNSLNSPKIMVNMQATAD